MGKEQDRGVKKIAPRGLGAIFTLTKSIDFLSIKLNNILYSTRYGIRQGVRHKMEA